MSKRARENTFFNTCEQQDLGAVNELLCSGFADVNCTNENGETALLVACRNNKPKLVKVLLEHKANSSIASKAKETALNIAHERGYEDIICLLFATREETALPVDDGSTILFRAAADGNNIAVKSLLAKGLNPHQIRDGYTLLSIASERGHLAVVRLLLAKMGKGCDEMNHDAGQGSPLRLAAQSDHRSAVKALLQEGADANFLDQSGRRPLTVAAYSGHTEIVQLLLKNKASFAEKNKAGWSPMALAAYGGHTDVIQLLLSEGANPNQTDQSDRTLLHIACENRHASVVAELILGGANVSAQDSDKKQPNYVKALEGDARDSSQVIVFLRSLVATSDDLSCWEENLLIKISDSGGSRKNSLYTMAKALFTDQGYIDFADWLSRIEPDRQAALWERFDRKGDIWPLLEKRANDFIYACKKQPLPMIKSFLDEGEDPNLNCGKGFRPLHYVARRGDVSMLKLLMERGARLNESSDSGVSALALSVKSGHEEAARFLFLSGAKDIANRMDRTALYYAHQKRHYRIFIHLIGGDVASYEKATVKIKSAIRYMVFHSYRHTSSYMPQDIFYDFLQSIHQEERYSRNQAEFFQALSVIGNVFLKNFTLKFSTLCNEAREKVLDELSKGDRGHINADAPMLAKDFLDTVTATATPRGDQAQAAVGLAGIEEVSSKRRCVAGFNYTSEPKGATLLSDLTVFNGSSKPEKPVPLDFSALNF